MGSWSSRSRGHLVFIVVFPLLSGTQGGRFMTTAMFSAREAMIPGGMYDRSRGMVNGGEYMPLPYLSMYLSICLFFMLVVQEEEVLSLSLVSWLRLSFNLGGSFLGIFFFVKVERAKEGIFSSALFLTMNNLPVFLRIQIGTDITREVVVQSTGSQEVNHS